MNSLVFIIIAIGLFSVGMWSLLSIVYGRTKEKSHLKSSLGFRVVYLGLFLGFLSSIFLWGHNYLADNAKDFVQYYYLIFTLNLLLVMVVAKRSITHLLKLLFSVNLLRKAIQGSRIVRGELYETIFKNYIDWGIVIAIVAMIIPLVPSRNFTVIFYVKVFLACLILSGFIFFIFHYRKYLRENKLFQSLKPIKEIADFSTTEEVLNGLNVVASFDHPELFEKLIKDLPSLSHRFVKLVSDKNASFGEVTKDLDNFLGDNLEDQEVQQMIREANKFEPLLACAKKIGGLPNFLVLALSLNEFRRVESKHYDLYRLLWLLIISGIALALIYAIEKVIYEMQVAG